MIERKYHRNCECGERKNVVRFTIQPTTILQEWFCSRCSSLKDKKIIPLATNHNKYRYLSIKGKAIPMHRWVYENVNNVTLQSDQDVHHVDCIKSNNLPVNLICPDKHGPDKHFSHHIYKINALKKRIAELEGILYEQNNQR